MKKIIYAVMLLLCMSIVGCQKEETEPQGIMDIREPKGNPDPLLDKNAIILCVGESDEIQVLHKQANVKWSTSNEAVATVSNGIVTAISIGTADITAQKIENNSIVKTGKCEVTVIPKQQAGFITFSDQSAKYACLEKFDKDNDGEISYSEAAEVVSIQGLFDDWKTVKRFDEIRYFINITSLSAAFRGTDVEGIEIPSNIKELSYGEFQGCSKLRFVTLPNEITSIPEYAFEDCASLTDICIPKSVENIGQSAFAYSGIEKIVVPEGVTVIERSTFEGCPLQSVSLPSTLVEIEERSFWGVSLWKLELPAAIKRIGDYNFNFVNNVIIPADSFVTIGETSFSGNMFIFVKENLINQYYLRTNWSEHKAQIYPLEQYRDKKDYDLLTEGFARIGTGIKWAACNIDANSPDVFGGVYAWGEIETKSDYTWNAYKWCNGTNNTITKYCPSKDSEFWAGDGNPDNKITLDPEDDVAHVKLGEMWRMPTSNEYKDLLSLYYEPDEYNGCKGEMFYFPAEGKKIFLPINYGSNRYWSSSLTTSQYAEILYIGWTFDVPTITNNHCERSSAGYVRPVSD